MSYVERHLLPNETLVYRAHLNWTIYLVATVLCIIAVASFVICWKEDNLTLGKVLGSIFLFLGFLSFLRAWIRSSSSEFAVTDKRVVIKTGFVQRRSVELLLRQVEGISVDQSILGRVFGYGSIVVIGTGGTKEAFAHIANPLEFRRQVQAQSVR